MPMSTPLSEIEIIVNKNGIAKRIFANGREIDNVTAIDIEYRPGNLTKCIVTINAWTVKTTLEKS